MELVYATCLLALGCWSAYATIRRVARRGVWRRHRTFLFVAVFYVASCFLPGVALVGRGFERWMVVPLGVASMSLVSFPCYFALFDRPRVRPARNAGLLLFGLMLVALGLGWLPFDWIGLADH